MCFVAPSRSFSEKNARDFGNDIENRRSELDKKAGYSLHRVREIHRVSQKMGALRVGSREHEQLSEMGTRQPIRSH